jgi:hypothetical protein
VYASGSTWAYNVLRGIAQVAHPAHVIRSGFVGTQADLDAIDTQGDVLVVKSHDLPDRLAAQLLGREPRILATIRDPRDAVTSLMKYQHYPFDMALDTIANSAGFVAGLVGDPRTLLLRFETRFPENPATIDHIATHLGASLPPQTRDRLFAALSRQTVESEIAAMDTQPDAIHDPRSGDIFHPQTQWHRHHAGRTGEIGRWRSMLSLAQRDAVQHRMASWMTRFGYQPHTPPVFNFGGFDPFRAARGT